MTAAMRYVRPYPMILLTLLASSTAIATESSRDGETLFESKVRPLLVEKCHECHGAKLAESGLRLDSRQALLRGSDAGAVVVPGDTANSRLLAVVKHAEGVTMPPDTKLSDDEIAAIEAWVKAGVPWPGNDDDDLPVSREDEMRARIDGALASHWSFRPPERHDAPDLATLPRLPPPVAATWSRSAIDRFIAAGLAASDLAPAAEAEPRQLFRRLHYDLIGLPPPADEADAFAANPSDDVYQATVDRLLASREHAEHWARHWLDLARYADSEGYHPSKIPWYPHSWTYRDWVVKALHDDVRYDRFVTLQLAADRLEPAAPAADLAALGFLTVGSTFYANKQLVIDDRIDLVTRGLMGLTVACARCHDHKYEPVSATDYYALHGVFSSCWMPDKPEELPVIGEPPGRDTLEHVAKRAELEAALAEKPDDDADRKALEKHEAAAVGEPSRAMVVTERGLTNSRIHLRGDPGRLHGDAIPRRFLELLGGATFDPKSSGRLDLASAIVSPDNPLTARVVVNWVWMHHFGRGLVPTPGDFGLRGEPPSHPELLDDLARRFIDEGRWSFRWLHREIVLSRTWRQSAAAAAATARDPDNRLFGRATRRRLSWEAWRDSLLTAAGTLDRGSFGGPGINPESLHALHARTIYSRIDRANVPYLAQMFDVAATDTAVHCRCRTSVPQQGLAVLNSPLVVAAARRLADRTLAVGDTEDLRISALWRHALARSPTNQELALARSLLVDAGAGPAIEGFGPWERLAQAVLATAEFHYVD